MSPRIFGFKLIVVTLFATFIGVVTWLLHDYPQHLATIVTPVATVAVAALGVRAWQERKTQPKEMTDDLLETYRNRFLRGSRSVDSGERIPDQHAD